MEIRKLTIEDYDGIYKLWINTSGMGLNTTDDSRAGIQKYLQRNPNTCYVAEEDNVIIGIIMSGHDGRRGFIHHTAVEVTKRKTGIGSLLLEHAMKALKDEGINKVSLVVFSHNEMGNTFWENHHFIARDDLIYRNKNINKIHLYKNSYRRLKGRAGQAHELQ